MGWTPSLYNVNMGHVVRRPVVGVELLPLPPKQYTPIYCNLSDIGAFYGGRAATRSAGGQDMVGAGGVGLGRSAGSGKGGGGVGVNVSVRRLRLYKGLRRRV